MTPKNYKRDKPITGINNFDKHTLFIELLVNSTQMNRRVPTVDSIEKNYGKVYSEHRLRIILKLLF